MRAQSDALSMAALTIVVLGMSYLMYLWTASTIISIPRSDNKMQIPVKIDAVMADYNVTTGKTAVKMVLRTMEETTMPDDLMLVVKDNRGRVVATADLNIAGCSKSVCAISVDVNVTPGEYLFEVSSGVSSIYPEAVHVPSPPSDLYCDSCTSCSDAFNTAEQISNLLDANVVIHLTADINSSNSNCVTFSDISPADGQYVIFDGGGHTIMVNDTSPYGAYYVVYAYPLSDRVVLRNFRGASTGDSYGMLLYIQGGVVENVEVNSERTALHLAHTSSVDVLHSEFYSSGDSTHTVGVDSSANFVDVNIYALGSGSTAIYLNSSATFDGVSLYAPDPSSVYIRASVRPSGGIIFSATNSFCGDGRKILAINSSNVSDYNAIPLDANAYCHISVYRTNDFVLDFNNTSVDVRSIYLLANIANGLTLKNASITVRGTGAVAFGGYAVYRSRLENLSLRSQDYYTVFLDGFYGTTLTDTNLYSGYGYLFTASAGAFASATNSFCGDGRKILAINSSNVSDYNAIPLDANAYCHISVYRVPELVLAFDGTPVEVNSLYLSVYNSSGIELYGLNAVIHGDYLNGVHMYEVDNAKIHDANVLVDGTDAVALYISHSNGVILRNVDLRAEGSVQWGTVELIGATSHSPAALYGSWSPDITVDLSSGASRICAKYRDGYHYNSVFDSLTCTGCESNNSLYVYHSSSGITCSCLTVPSDYNGCIGG